jgi:hypothetical protein
MSKFLDKMKYHEQKILTEMAYGFSTTAKTISQSEMVDLIKGITETDAPIKFTSITDATHVKSAKRNTIGTVYKISQVEGLLNSDYAARKQEKMSQTTPGAVYQAGQTYGTHITGSVVEHNGKMYIQVLPEKSEKPRFVVKSNIGKYSEEDKTVVAPVIAPSKPSTSDEVVIRRYGAGSIVAVEVSGQSYVIDLDPNDPLAADRKEALDIVNGTKPL